MEKPKKGDYFTKDIRIIGYAEAYRCQKKYSEALEDYINYLANSSNNIPNVSEIEKRATKSTLLSYYVGIYERKMSVEDVLNSIESDLDFIEGELTIEEAKNILNGR